MAPRRRAPFPPSSSSCSSVVTDELGEKEVWKPLMVKKGLKKKTRAKKGAPMTVAALHAVVEATSAALHAALKAAAALHAAVEAAAATRIPWTKAETEGMLRVAEVLVSEKTSEVTKLDQDIKTLREILDLIRDGMRRSFNR